MSDPIDVSIQAALCAWLQDGNLGYPISWPFVEYAPTTGVPFLEARPVMRAKPQRFGISFTNGSNVLRGVFQVDAVTPDNQGEAPALQMAGAVAALFAIGTNLTAGGRRLQIVNLPTIAAATVADAPWVRLPVSIPYLLVN